MDKTGEVLKIGLNATCLNDRPSGAKQRFVGIYGELVKRLPDAECVVYEPADYRVGAWFDGAPNVTARRTPLPSEGRVSKFLQGIGDWFPCVHHRPWRRQLLRCSRFHRTQVSCKALSLPFSETVSLLRTS